MSLRPAWVGEHAIWLARELGAARSPTELRRRRRHRHRQQHDQNDNGEPDDNSDDGDGNDICCVFKKGASFSVLDHCLKCLICLNRRPRLEILAIFVYIGGISFGVGKQSRY